MFVTNKRVLLPSNVLVNGVSVEVVSSFILLGVILDNRLSFSSYAVFICKPVNQKLFSIKRIFYLSTSVEIQFLKSFILPYFDYCCSLFINLHKCFLQKLSNLYYLCLLKLFKLNSTSDSIQTTQFLKKYNLFSLQHRIFVRFARFSNRIYFDDNAPLSHRTQLRTKVVESVNLVACFLTKELRYNRKITISETYNT